MQEEINMETIAVVVIENQYKQVLLIHKHGEWMLPGGLVLDEEPSWTLFRGVYEETGLEVIDFVMFIDQDFYIDKKQATYNFKFFSATYSGLEPPSISPWEKYKGLEEVRWFSRKTAEKLKLSEMTIVGLGN